MSTRELVRRGRREVLILLGLSVWVLLAGRVLAADLDYPTKPVTIHVGFAAGGGAHIGATIVTGSSNKYQRQPFIINPRVGASGLVAADYFLKQPADGYNLFWITPDSTVALAKDPTKVSFGLKDFLFLGSFYHAPFCVIVPNNSPFKTIEEFIDYGKKHPNEMTASTSGIGGGQHLALEVFMREAGVKFIHVPFPTGTVATTAMLGGHVTWTVGSLVTLNPYLKSGQARVLVVFDTRRSGKYPEVPTAIEKGYSVVRTSRHALTARKGTPRPILDYMVKLFEQLGNDPAVQSKLIDVGNETRYMGPEETEKYYTEDYALASGIFKELGLLEK
jgi:tripartite-type tricarboxylate transporter receptor subunit TctC